MTQVAWEDVQAYAAWVGKELPTEAEWEYAARGGLEGKVYTWGDEFKPRGRMMANTWQGEFPWQNLLEDRYERTSPVRSFPPNGYGLYDMAGNVWEWTIDYYAPRHADDMTHACCGPPVNPRVTSPDLSYDVGRPGEQFPRAGGQGRIAPVCAELLLALSAGGSPGAIDRDFDGPSWLQMHRSSELINHLRGNRPGRRPTRRPLLESALANEHVGLCMGVGGRGDVWP